MTRGCGDDRAGGRDGVARTGRRRSARRRACSGREDGPRRWRLTAWSSTSARPRPGPGPRNPTRNNARSAAIMCRDGCRAIQHNFNSAETRTGEFIVFYARQQRLAGAQVRRALPGYAHTIAQIRSIFGPKTPQFALQTAAVRGASDSPMAIVLVGYSAKGDKAWPSRQSGSQRWQAFDEVFQGPAVMSASSPAWKQFVP